MACLIKPQFEAGREKVGKKGVVRDPAVHREVIEMVTAYAKSIFFQPLNLEYSPIKGPEGKYRISPAFTEKTRGQCHRGTVV